MLKLNNNIAPKIIKVIITIIVPSPNAETKILANIAPITKAPFPKVFTKIYLKN